jgi:hypothetical protein
VIQIEAIRIIFYNWSVQTGPIFEQASDVWDKIEADLQKNDVGGAAGRLRRHSEYVAAELADQLGATPTYRGDFSYDLGDLLPAVIGRQGELLKLAAKAASDWKDADAKARVEALKQARTDALAAYSRMDVVVTHLIVRTHFRASGFLLKVGKGWPLVFQVYSSPPIIGLERRAVLRNRPVVGLSYLFFLACRKRPKAKVLVAQQVFFHRTLRLHRLMINVALRKWRAVL